MLNHQIIAEHPAPLLHNQVLVECINACYDCAHACMSCADACLAEDDVSELRSCIQTDWNCADLCHATARVLSRQTEGNIGLLVAQLKCCREACEICARECARHGDKHRHCAMCADTCEVCAETCRELLKTAESGGRPES